MSTVSELEIRFFTKRLAQVPLVLDNLEIIKLYGRGKVLDLGKLETKSTKSNTTPDIVDLQAIDMDMELRAVLFALCREYEESVMVPVTDRQGRVTGQAPLPPVESSDPAVMVAYLSDPASLEWMRFQQDFEDRACEIVELIEAAIKYTTASKIVKPRTVLGLEVMANRFRNSIEDYPRTPMQMVRLLNGAGYPIALKSITNWVQYEKIKPAGMVGKREGYAPSEVIDVYLASMKQAAKDTFVNRVA
jgi:hypothetical protein